NGLRVAVSGVFAKARRAGRWHGVNPVRDVERRRVPRRAYDFLRPHEVAPVLSMALELYGPIITAAFALAVYLGLRRGEVAGLQKRDVDLLQGTLVVRRSHGQDRVKGGHEVVLPIHPELKAFLVASMSASPCEYVCPDPETAERMPEHFDLED